MRVNRQTERIGKVVNTKSIRIQLETSRTYLALQKIVVILDTVLFRSKTKSISKLKSRQTITTYLLSRVQTVAESACLLQQHESSLTLLANVTVKVVR